MNREWEVKHIGDIRRLLLAAFQPRKKDLAVHNTRGQHQRGRRQPTRPRQHAWSCYGRLVPLVYSLVLSVVCTPGPISNIVFATLTIWL